MKYEITIPAILGDVIPLYFVADAMAGAASTAFGTTSSHKPIYDRRLLIHIKYLMDDARTGKLVVCNRAGYQCTVVEIIEAAKKSGNLQESHRYAVESDLDKAYANCIHSKLHCLNEWGKTRGDEFSIAAESAAWVDERGYMNPTVALYATVDTAPVTTPAPTSEEQAAAAATVETAHTTTTHKIQTRAQPLDAEIKVAKEHALDKNSPQSVWDALVKMADSKEGCLLGQGNLDEIKYGSSADIKFFTKRMLGDRMRRSIKTQ